MHFPVYLRLAQYSLNPHFVFEGTAYLVAFMVYLRLRHATTDVVGLDYRWSIIAAAALGAAIGSRVLAWFEDPGALAHAWNRPDYGIRGKTVVGGLIGALIAVEIAKRSMGITRHTGDLFAVPAVLG